MCSRAAGSPWSSVLASYCCSCAHHWQKLYVIYEVLLYPGVAVFEALGTRTLRYCWTTAVVRERGHEAITSQPEPVAVLFVGYGYGAAGADEHELHLRTRFLLGCVPFEPNELNPTYYIPCCTSFSRRRCSSSSRRLSFLVFMGFLGLSSSSSSSFPLPPILLPLPPLR